MQTNQTNQTNQTAPMTANAEAKAELKAEQKELKYEVNFYSINAKYILLENERAGGDEIIKNSLEKIVNDFKESTRGSKLINNIKGIKEDNKYYINFFLNNRPNIDNYGEIETNNFNCAVCLEDKTINIKNFCINNHYDNLICLDCNKSLVNKGVKCPLCRGRLNNYTLLLDDEQKERIIKNNERLNNEYTRLYEKFIADVEDTIIYYIKAENQEVKDKYYYNDYIRYPINFFDTLNKKDLKNLLKIKDFDINELNLKINNKEEKRELKKNILNEILSIYTSIDGDYMDYDDDEWKNYLHITHQIFDNLKNENNYSEGEKIIFITYRDLKYKKNINLFNLYKFIDYIIDISRIEEEEEDEIRYRETAIKYLKNYFIDIKWNDSLVNTEEEEKNYYYFKSKYQKNHKKCSRMKLQIPDEDGDEHIIINYVRLSEELNKVDRYILKIKTEEDAETILREYIENNYYMIDDLYNYLNITNRYNFMSQGLFNDLLMALWSSGDFNYEVGNKFYNEIIRDRIDIDNFKYLLNNYEGVDLWGTLKYDGRQKYIEGLTEIYENDILYNGFEIENFEYNSTE